MKITRLEIIFLTLAALSLAAVSCHSAPPPLPTVPIALGSFVYPADSRVEGVVVIKSNDSDTNNPTTWVTHGTYTGASNQLVKFPLDNGYRYWSAASTNSSGGHSGWVAPITNAPLSLPQKFGN